MAARLAEAGFPVLRFDYYGCGDSAGEAEQVSITRWLEDISTAIAELRARAGISQVCVIGLRLGGTLAAFAGSRRGDFDDLVLWDPVVNGKQYFKELLTLQQEMLRFRPKPKPWKKSNSDIEVCGFPMPRLLHAQLEELDLGTIAEKPAARVFLVQNARSNDEGGLTGHLIQTRAEVESRTLEAPKIWLPMPDGSLLVPAQVLQSVVSWVCGVHA